MKNTILNYDVETLQLETDGNEFDVSDYFSKDVAIYNIIYSATAYLETYQIQNDDKLERIAYELYGNTDYWDILLMLNDRNPLFEMPYNYDLLVDDATDLKNYYRNIVYSNPPLQTTRANILYEKFLDDNVTANGEYRIIFIVKPEKMSNFISLLKTNGYLG